jgi:hypothetical protein
LPYFRIKGKTPFKSHIISMKITPSVSAYQKTLLWRFQAPIGKNVEFGIFCFFQKKDHGSVFICLFFSFPQEWSYRTSGPRMYSERAHSNGNEKL